MYSFVIRPYIRFALAVLLGVVAYLLVPHSVHIATRSFIGWNVGAIFLLGVLWVMMANSDAEETFRRSQQEEPAHYTSLSIVVLTSAVGLGATAIMFDDPKPTDLTFMENTLHVILTLTTVVTSFFIVHVYYAIHYARLYYDETGEAGKFVKGLEFPDKELVDYWDFIYYSFTIAMCYQTSDVTVTTPKMRRLTIAHAVISFFFVTGVLGSVLNIVVSL